jgi:hypothetical protein
MPRGHPTIDLLKYKTLISSMYLSGYNMGEIADFLQMYYNTCANTRTIKRQLQEWEVKKRTKIIQDKDENL